MQTFDEKIIITGIHTIAKINTPKGMHEFPPKLPHNELIFKTNGHSVVTVANNTEEEKPGTIRVMPADIDFGYYSSTVTDDSCEVVDIFFDTNIPISDTVFYIDNMNTTETRQLILNIYNAWKGKASGYYAKSMSILYKLISFIQRECSYSYLPSETYKKIEPAIQYIEAHAFDDEQFDYKHLSELCGISYSYLRTLFAKKYKMSPQYYVQHLRLLHACDLLATGLYNVTNVSEMSGFQSLSYFSRAFKNKFGVSPNEYSSHIQ